MNTMLQLPPLLRHAAFTAFQPSSYLSPTYQLLRFSTSSILSTSTPLRTYSEALSLLESLQSNKSIRSSISNNSIYDMNLTAIPEMLEWTHRAGYKPEDFAKAGLRFIHVAGTKGKGSVCALVEGLLIKHREGPEAWEGRGGRRRKQREGQMGKTLGKIGTYTSPHLITVRERIRIDGLPISESSFTHYFFELWDRISSSRSTFLTADSEKPSYFRFLTLLALHIFVRENIESAIIECGIGGEYDSTNILPSEAVTVTGITTLGIDHVGMLGDDIQSIAWHKAGIMKHGVPAFTLPQDPQSQGVLDKRAMEKGVKLSVIQPLPILQSLSVRNHLSRTGPFSTLNASLALALACTHLFTMGIPNVPSARSFRHISDSPPSFPPHLLNALRTTTPLPGRHTVIKESPSLEWYVDGAHTIDSIRVTARWYRSIVHSSLQKERVWTVLIFNQQDGGRDAGELLKVLLHEMRKEVSVWPERENQGGGNGSAEVVAPKPAFASALFCRNEAFKDDQDGERSAGRENVKSGLKPQEDLAELYRRLNGSSLNEVLASVEEAVESVRNISWSNEERDSLREKEKAKVMVLVTGSLHLVGGLLRVLDRDGVDIVMGKREKSIRNTERLGIRRQVTVDDRI